MNTELQNKVWSILPKEFRKEVKKMYESTQLTGLQPFEDVERADMYAGAMCAIFGEDNLTSDAEEEEMLTVSANIVCAYKENIDKYLPSAYSDYDKGFWVGQKAVFEDLFGSKCLPDELNEDNFAKSEPKFKIGDKVRVKFNAKELHSNPDPSKKIYYWQTTRDKYLGKVFKITDIWKSGTITLNTSEIMFWEPFDLEPYTEPEENQTLSDSTELKPQDVDKHFDNILKDRFRDYNRLHIAAMAMQGILSNSDRMKVYERIATEPPCEELAVVVARNALRYADTLMAKAKKGGQNE